MLGTASSASSHDHAAVNSQLARILESPHFRNSKRSQALLRFILESALSGDHAPLKERSIGAAVFGREIAYDTAQDPIVRNAAIEVRKRLAQYYLEPEHAGELRDRYPDRFLHSFVPGRVSRGGANQTSCPCTYKRLISGCSPPWRSP